MPSSATAGAAARAVAELKLDVLDAAAALGVEEGAAPPLRLRNYIGGAFLDAASGAALRDLNPATGRAIAEVPRSDARDVETAVAAAAAAFPAWRDTPVAARASRS
jgi:delta 1-pyrroline-5-carboxylate dehydrogenase